MHTASSYFEESTLPQRARLFGKSAWVAKSERNQYLQVRRPVVGYLVNSPRWAGVFILESLFLGGLGQHVATDRNHDARLADKL